MNRLKHKLMLIPVMAIMWVQCAEPPQSTRYESFRGETMGTYYKVNFINTESVISQSAIDSILKDVNNELSTYIPHSLISRFNDNSTPELRVARNSGMAVNLLASAEVYRISAGAFDPTVMPLVNYWGFGYTGRNTIQLADSMVIDSLLTFVGFKFIHIDSSHSDSLFITKLDPRLQLDFSAIAKGYGTDEVARYLSYKGIENFMVDIGGEVVTRGRNRRGMVWRFGVQTPDPSAQTGDIESVVLLDHTALATSGNYRNFHITHEGMYAHTIDPHTGFPKQTNVLSATIIAGNAMMADALATMSMVLGYPEAATIIASLEGVEGLFILGGEDGSYELELTDGMQALLIE